MPQPSSRRLITEASLAPLVVRVDALDSKGQRGYTIDQSVGRVIKVWDYINNREQIIYGDTGWRSIKDTLPAGVTASNAWMRRQGNEVTLNLQALTTGAGIVTVYALPTGYRPDGPSVRSGFVSDGTTVRVASPFSGNFRLLNMPGGAGTWDGSVTFTTADPWPTTLPGVAA